MKLSEEEYLPLLTGPDEDFDKESSNKIKTFRNQEEQAGDIFGDIIREAYSK